jgi:acyl-CoA synthetase (AMP-forming)/AMP-acid ligase II
MINRGGSKSAPEMIEEVLRQVPEIGDAAVFAVPNTDWAAVVCKGQLRQNEILDICRQKLGGAAPDRLFVSMKFRETTWARLFATK